jgi:hypothetical protein
VQRCAGALAFVTQRSVAFRVRGGGWAARRPRISGDAPSQIESLGEKRSLSLWLSANVQAPPRNAYAPTRSLGQWEG